MTEGAGFEEGRGRESPKPEGKDGEGGACEGGAEKRQSQPVLTKEQFQFRQGTEEKRVQERRAVGGVEQCERLEVVPSARGHPAVSWLAGVSSDEACGVGGSQGADGARVREQSVEDCSWHEAVAEGLVEERGGWKLHAFRDAEGCNWRRHLWVAREQSRR